MATQTVCFAVSDKDLVDLEKLVEYFGDGNRTAFLRASTRVMKSVMHAERLREIQAYGARKAAGQGITADDIPAICRRVLKGRE